MWASTTLAFVVLKTMYMYNKICERNHFTFTRTRTLRHLSQPASQPAIYLSSRPASQPVVYPGGQPVRDTPTRTSARHKMQ
jgi:hypothetical protein